LRRSLVDTANGSELSGRVVFNSGIGTAGAAVNAAHKKEQIQEEKNLGAGFRAQEHVDGRLAQVPHNPEPGKNL
jgi:hypothetical protein